MAKAKTTEEPGDEITPAPPTFEVVGFQISDEILISVEGRQVNLANPTPELTAWLYDRREKLSGLRWNEQA